MKKQKHSATVQQTADRFNTRAINFLLNDSFVEVLFEDSIECLEITIELVTWKNFLWILRDDFMLLVENI